MDHNKSLRYKGYCSIGCKVFVKAFAPVSWLEFPGHSAQRLQDTDGLTCRFFSPVSNKHPFVDSNLLYQFRMNFRRRRRLMELLSEKSPSSQETHDSPFCLRKQSHDNRKSTSFMSGVCGRSEGARACLLGNNSRSSPL